MYVLCCVFCSTPTVKCCHGLQCWKKNGREKIRVELSTRQIAFFGSCLSRCAEKWQDCDCNTISSEGSQNRLLQMACAEDIIISGPQLQQPSQKHRAYKGLLIPIRGNSGNTVVFAFEKCGLTKAVFYFSL